MDLLCNVWNASSARTAESLGYTMVGTSSGAIADSLGYEDGEKMSFNELAYMVDRIKSAIDLPLSVDLEAGYSRDPGTIVDHIERLSELGIQSINLEDSLVGHSRMILPKTAFADLLSKIKAEICSRGIETFINVRTDTYLLNVKNRTAETIERGKAYKASGADGLFVPCLTTLTDMEEIIQAVDLPLNVMCMPDLPDFQKLSAIGVSRVSMGDFVYQAQKQFLKQTLEKIHIEQSFNEIF